MTEGFGKIKVKINFDAVDDILKKYKKIKKYQRSSVFAVKTMDGTEEIVSKLIQEANEIEF